MAVNVKFGHVIVLILLAGQTFNPVETLEPITTGVAVTGAVFGSLVIGTWDVIKCKLKECCQEPWVKANITGLAVTLHQKLYGQHLVSSTVIQAIKGHWYNRNPSKALVLSFHGWTGGGKNYVSRMIAEHLFKMGLQSNYVHLFVSTLHFPHKSRLPTYQDQLRDWVRGNVSDCGRSLFIFDEMDKMPNELIDTIKPYLDHYPEVNGIDYRKATFIFLSNTGGHDINEKVLKHWQDGEERENLSLNEMEEILLPTAFNEIGGLWHSSLIEKNLIDAFIPFLPLERRHVKMCVRDDLRAKSLDESEEFFNKVAEEMQYFPANLKLFSTSGCKRVSQKVDFVKEKEEFSKLKFG